MESSFKILIVSGSIIVLGIWPLFYGNFIDRTTNFPTPNGWVFIGIAAIAIIGNGLMIHFDDKRSAEQQDELKKHRDELIQQLQDINTAIEKSGSRYDSSTKTVIHSATNVNTGNAAFLLQGSEHIVFDGNLTVRQNFNSNVTDVILEDDFLQLVNDFMTKYKISSKVVSFAKVRNTIGKQDEVIAELKNILINNGYTVKDKGGLATREDNRGIALHTFDGGLLITVGNVDPSSQDIK